MDDYRTLVLLVAVLIIAGIVIDGIRRNRRDRRNDLPFMLRGEVPEPADRFNGELPSGGARILRADYRGGGSRDHYDRQDPEFGDIEPVFGSAKGEKKARVEIKFKDKPAPVSASSRPASASAAVNAANGEVTVASKPKLRMRVSAGASGSISQQVAAQRSVQQDDAYQSDEDQILIHEDAAIESSLASADQDAADTRDSLDHDAEATAALLNQPITQVPKERLKTKYGVRYQRQRRASDEVERVERESAFESSAQQPETILVKLVAGRGKVFDGESLLRCMVSCGLRYSEKEKLFYRHEQHNGKGQKLFGLANLSKTGQFDYDTMRTLRTPGVCLYLSLPGPRRSQNALELMMDTARRLAVQLGGDMMDESNSVITAQTIEHYRQRVVEFERVSMQRLTPA